MLTAVTGINWGDEGKGESLIFSPNMPILSYVIRVEIMPATLSSQIRGNSY